MPGTFFHRFLMMVAAVLLSSQARDLRADQTVQVYDTYWPAEKIMPLIKDELGPSDTVNVFRNKLVVRTSSDHHAAIAHLLEQVDHPPRNLVISLRKARPMDDDSGDVSYENGTVRIQAGGSGNVAVYRGNSQSSRIERVEVQRESISTGNDGVIQQIRVIEGEEGMLRLGEDRPVDSVTMNQNGMTTTTQYRAEGDVLFVTPQLTSHGVRVEVRSQSAHAATDDPHARVNTAGIDTVITARTGLWTPIGGTTHHDRSANTDSISYSTRGMQDGDLQYQIKVDLMQ